MLIFPEALPHIDTFLKPVDLGKTARILVIRRLVAFLMHLGKMSASQAAGSVRTQARHRAQISRFLGRSYWRRTDLLGPSRRPARVRDPKGGLHLRRRPNLLYPARPVG
jgi:hypothetical protein